ncbi:1,2-phenylacetyl-CoA epoxidase subunit PaaC [Streptomyces sp. NPDC006879]|uniref:1,2-phenylacetyl-CoA epoxidase subunit PaaC n=1 Tax=Streptomyces sp. NPDC006879 TaxID=3364767 RepID=UPI0036BE67E4
MSSSTAPAAQLDLAEYVVRLGDDALILSQRLCDWVTRAPTIEEDLALANLALDLLGHARTLLDHAGRLDGTGRGEDDFAFARTEREFRNALLVELPRGDFAFTIARQLVYAHYSRLLWTALESCADEVLAAFGTRAAREVEYHQMHAEQWTVRLGRGTAESRLRMQRGLDEVWPYTDELFTADALSDRLDAAGIAISPARLRPDWQRAVASVIEEARLSVPRPSWRADGGRTGLHSEAFGPLLAELQAVRRQHPGGSW